MGLRFRQSFQLFPGVRLNLGKGGLSASFGAPGATVNFGPQGMRSTIGLPGTGISYSHRHTAKSPIDDATAFASDEWSVPPPLQPSIYQPLIAGMRQINSAAVEELTSHSLVELRDMISQARSQKHDIEADLRAAIILQEQQSQELQKKRSSLFRFFHKGRIATLEEGLPLTNSEVQRLSDWLNATHIDVTFETSAEAKRAYGGLVRAFEKLRGSKMIWDVASDRSTSRVAERSAASRTLTRIPVNLSYATSDLIRFGQAMQFENANGEEILIYPGRNDHASCRRSVRADRSPGGQTRICPDQFRRR